VTASVDAPAVVADYVVIVQTVLTAEDDAVLSAARALANLVLVIDHQGDPR
jgi:hypothetical protein